MAERQGLVGQSPLDNCPGQPCVPWTGEGAHSRVKCAQMPQDGRKPPIYYVREAAPKLQDAQEESVYRRAGWLLGLGSPIRSEVDLAERLERGLTVNAARSLRMRLGLTDEEIYQLVAPRRTLTRREAEGQPLTAEEADRVVRIARVAARAQQVFGARPEYAQEWLRTPQHALGGRPPLRLLGRDSGARAVEELLLALEHGFLA